MNSCLEIKPFWLVSKFLKILSRGLPDYLISSFNLSSTSASHLEVEVLLVLTVFIVDFFKVFSLFDYLSLMYWVPIKSKFWNSLLRSSFVMWSLSPAICLKMCWMSYWGARLDPKIDTIAFWNVLKLSVWSNGPCCCKNAYVELILMKLL